jgi:hypothetical protein
VRARVAITEPAVRKPARKDHNAGGKSSWMQGFFGRPSATLVEDDRRMNSIWCAGQARRSSRCMAQSLGSGVSPEAHVVQEGPPRRPVETTRVFNRCERACADCFRSPTPSPRLWAASPGATPARLCEHTMRVFNQPSK